MPLSAPTPAPQENVLPPQTVTQVSGKSSVDALKMSPNSSVLLLDNTQPVVWLCTSDGIGKVTAVPYDISEHKDKTQADVDSLETRVARIEGVLSNLVSRAEERGNANANESNDGSDKFREKEIANGKHNGNKK